MNLGEQDDHGMYGMLDENDDGLLCHECGRRFTHLGLHAWRGHGMSADEYRRADHFRPRRSASMRSTTSGGVCDGLVTGVQARSTSPSSPSAW